MNHILARTILVSMSFFLCSANASFSARRLCNGILGNLVEGLFKLANQQSGTLSSAHEEFVRSVAKEMNIEGVDVYAYHPLRAYLGPHCLGNNLYFSDDWFNTYKKAPLSQKFVIAHELAHVEKAHVLPRVMFQFGIPLIGWYLFRKLDKHYKLSEKAYASLEEHTPWISKSYREVGCDFFIYSNIVSACYRLGALLASKLSRSQEFEADAIALERLAPLYGADEIREAAADFFKTVEGFEPDLKSPLSTHPHSGERLRELGLKKSVSEEAGALIYSLLEKRVHLRIECILCPEEDEEQNIITVYRFTNNWTKLVQAARICSVHQDVAQKCIEGLHAETYLALFKELIESMNISDEDKAEYEEAIKDNCETIILCLQEKS